jgi:ATP-dependent DNA helicase RecG
LSPEIKYTTMKISEILEQPEGRKIEFKQELPIKSDLLKTAVAFANDSGGMIIIGIKDNPRMITGVPEQELLTMEEQLSNMIYANCEPTIIPDISFAQADGKHIVKVLIHKGNTPPYYVRRKGLNDGVFIRVGSSSRPASPENISELMRKRQSISFDSEVVYGKSVEDIKLDSIKEQFYKATNQTLDEVAMAKLELVRKEQGVLLPTNALILLSDDEIHYRLFRNASIACALFKGTDPTAFIDQKTITGNIASQPEEAYEFVLRHISNVTVGYKGVYRMDRWEYPVVAIREAIRNAVIHRDYSISGSEIRLAIFDNRIELTSPGKLMSSIDFDDMESGQSEIRNKTLAPVFKKLGIIEKWGNGLKIISKEMKAYPEISLTWKEPGMLFKLIFTKLNYEVKTYQKNDESILVANDGEPTIKYYPKTKKAITKTARDTGVVKTKTPDKILQLLQLNPKLSSAKLAEVIGNISLDGINYHLKKLTRKGVIKHHGPANGGYWEIFS